MCCPSKCEVLLQDWTAVLPRFILYGKQLAIVDRYSYRGGFLIRDVSAALEVITHISKSRAAYAGLKRL